MPPKRSKYKAQPIVIDGHRFHSKKEGNRYTQLRLLQKAGEIHGIELQPKFTIAINGIHICDYFADFLYLKSGNNDPIVEDVKGFKTPLYRLKKRLVEAKYGIRIEEV